MGQRSRASILFSAVCDGNNTYDLVIFMFLHTADKS
ncbi:hypothetical protein SLEP1_g41531 [Rubroshorea leprosula]|uniref:Uncharacterized protein n=1 Tax=Rubroshorea leprosula TaxID=152421 RepID=A0AAV5L6T8_9ROSI|nr:hypothetical protein SLEP1_g41531 [Rubroshorea leprosula]